MAGVERAPVASRDNVAGLAAGSCKYVAAAEYTPTVGTGAVEEGINEEDEDAICISDEVTMRIARMPSWYSRAGHVGGGAMDKPQASSRSLARRRQSPWGGCFC